MLITPEYKAQQAKLHAIGNYGVTASKYGKTVSDIIDRVEINHVLDYGCGSNRSLTETLKPARNIVYQPYDPCVPEVSDDPVPADMVVCIDVLEHIEPALLDDVLDHLHSLTERALFVSINTGPAGKVLDDGRNAHLIQKPMAWWLPKLFERYIIQTVQAAGPQEFFVIAQPLDFGIDIPETGPKPVIHEPIIVS